MSAAIPIEARFSMRPFALQFRELASRPIPATASTLPAYTFEAILGSDSARSVPRSRPHSVFCDVMGRYQHAEPVAFRDPRTHDLSSNIGSPPGSFDPSGSKRQSDVRTMKLTIAGCPIFLPSPQRGNNFGRRSAPRIIGPDPLLPARLAVPQTSWNHSHHAPLTRSRSIRKCPVSSGNKRLEMC